MCGRFQFYGALYEDSLQMVHLVLDDLGGEAGKGGGMGLQVHIEVAERHPGIPAAGPEAAQAPAQTSRAERERIRRFIMLSCFIVSMRSYKDNKRLELS